MSHLQNPDWFQVQEELKKSMQSEVTIMREILSNLLQEEVSLVQQDKTYWTHLMQTRFFMIEQVKEFRIERMSATKRLLSFSSKSSLEDLLKEEDESICEITILLDQLIALSEKINRQNMRNQLVSEMTQHLVAIPNYISYPKAQSEASRRKNFLMTMPENS